MRKGDMVMLEREWIRIIQLLQANDDMVFRCLGPASFFNQCAAYGGKFFVVEYPLAKRVFGAALNVDGVAGVEEGFGGGGGEGGTVFHDLVLRTEVNDDSRHYEQMYEKLDLVDRLRYSGACL